MDLRQLKQFIAVAEMQSFRKAADRLHMAQPPLSVAIRKLEEEIGVTLLERNTRGVRLTEPGQAALVAAKRCIEQAENVKASAQAAANGDAGRLRIGFIGSVTFGLMPRLIHAFNKKYPNVKLELIEANNQSLLDAIESDALDLVFLRIPTTRPTEINFQIIQEDVFVAALPTHHPYAKKKSLCMKDLSEQLFISYVPSRVGGLHAAVSHILHSAGVAPRITQEAMQVHTVIGLVESGLGIALIPSINTSITSDRVVFKKMRDIPKVSPIGIALAHHTQRVSPAAQRFKDLAVKLSQV